MAQTGYTPIQLYYSSTTTNVPLAANLASGELAINITDGKLFYKDNANVVQVIGWKVVPATAGGTGQTSYAVGDLLYADTTTTLAKLPDVATGNALISGGVSTAPAWGKIGLTTHVSGTLPIANGGTGNTTGAATAVTSNSTSGLLQITGPAAASTRVATVPNANWTAARTDAAQTFTGDQTVSDNLFVGTTTASGSASNTKVVAGGRFRTVAGSVSAANSTATTLFTAPTALAAWLVTVNVDADATIYAATYLINTQGGSSTVATLIFKGSNISISMSGYDVKATQTSGDTATIQYSAIRIA